MDKFALKRYVEDNSRLIARRETSYPGLYVLKYKKRVFFEGLWNQFTEECRGTVVDADYNVVSRPFTKIYNYGIEAKAPRLSLDTQIRAYRKINGFMVAMTMHNDDILVSTTGSTDSPFVAMAKEQMQKMHSWKHWVDVFSNLTLKNKTVMFEVVHKNDPHIIPEKEGLYLLGYRENTWDSIVEHDSKIMLDLVDAFGCHKVEDYSTTVGELQTMAKECKHEGFVAYTENGVSFKIKSPYYLIQKALARKKDILSLNKELVEEEYFPLVSHLLEIKDHFNSLTEQDRLEYIRTFINK